MSGNVTKCQERRFFSKKCLIENKNYEKNFKTL